MDKSVKNTTTGLAAAVMLILMVGCGRGVRDADIDLPAQESAPEIAAVQEHTEPSSVDAAGEEPILRQLTENITLATKLPQAAASADVIGAEDLRYRLEAGIEALKLQDFDAAFRQTSENVWYDDRGSRLISISSPVFSYTTPFWEYVSNIVHYNKTDVTFNADSIATEGDLPFCSRVEAEGQILEALKALGAEDVSRITVYSLEHGRLAEAEQALKAELGEELQSGMLRLKESWTESDDCYCFFIEFGARGLPIYPGSFFDAEANAYMSGSFGTALLSSSGIRELQICYAYRQTDLRRQCTPITAERALEVLTERMGSLITSSHYTVIGAELTYVPEYADRAQKQLQLIPAWCFTVTEDYAVSKGGVSYGGTREITVLIDAESGREIA